MRRFSFKTSKRFICILPENIGTIFSTLVILPMSGLVSLVAVLILTIACINFMNLSTAQSSRRAKEIGVRKVAGANKRKIIFQFLGESLLIVFVAHVIAMILVELLLPGFNNIMYRE